MNWLNHPEMFVPLQLLAFLQGLFTFYHEGYELAHEFEPYKQQLQFNLQNVSLPHTHTHTHRPGRWGGVGWGGGAEGLHTKAAGPRNEIRRLIVPRHNEQSFHKWIAARWNEILRRARDQYFRLALWAVTAGCLTALCQKKEKRKEKLRVRSETAATLLSIGVTSALTAVGTKFRSDLKRRHRCPDSFHSVSRLPLSSPASSDAGSPNRSRRGFSNSSPVALESNGLILTLLDSEKKIPDVSILNLGDLR